jgi:hypothetical protein
MKSRVTTALVSVAGAAILVVAARVGSHRESVERLLPTPSKSPVGLVHATPEHAVILHLPLSAKGFGAKDEVVVCQQIEEDLEQEIDRAGAGEMDGNEIGDGECTLFMYGPDADKLFAAIASRARSSRLGKRAWATKRYGSVDDPNARETRVHL